MALRFDHVIVAVSDLDRASGAMRERYGLASTPGGRHEGLGTGNRIVPLGDDYVELMAVVDEDEARESFIARWVEKTSELGDSPGAVCLRTDDIETEAERRGLVTVPMTRITPDGERLSWRLAGVQEALADPSLPFFIEWDVPPEVQPGRAAVDHDVDVGGIAWVGLRGDPPRIEGWIGAADLDIRITEGDPAVTGVGIDSSSGEIVLT